MTIIGLRKVEFMAKDGGAVSGYSLFVSFADSNVIGKATEKTWVRPELFEKLLAESGAKNPADLVGLDVEPVYNRYGKIAGFDMTL